MPRMQKSEASLGPTGPEPGWVDQGEDGGGLEDWFPPASSQGSSTVDRLTALYRANRARSRSPGAGDSHDISYDADDQDADSNTSYLDRDPVLQSYSKPRQRPTPRAPAHHHVPESIYFPQGVPRAVSPFSHHSGISHKEALSGQRGEMESPPRLRARSPLGGRGSPRSQLTPQATGSEAGDRLDGSYDGLGLDERSGTQSPPCSPPALTRHQFSRGSPVPTVPLRAPSPPRSVSRLSPTRSPNRSPANTPNEAWVEGGAFGVVVDRVATSLQENAAEVVQAAWRSASTKRRLRPRPRVETAVFLPEDCAGVTLSNRSITLGDDSKRYEFTHIFDASTPITAVSKSLLDPLVDEVCGAAEHNGKATILMMDSEGASSMNCLGGEGLGKDRKGGLMQRAVASILGRIEHFRGGSSVEGRPESLSMTAMQVHNDVGLDLLSRTRVDIRDKGKDERNLVTLTEVEVESVDKFNDAVYLAMANATRKDKKRASHIFFRLVVHRSTSKPASTKKLDVSRGTSTPRGTGHYASHTSSSRKREGSSHLLRTPRQPPGHQHGTPQKSVALGDRGVLEFVLLAPMDGQEVMPSENHGKPASSALMHLSLMVDSIVSGDSDGRAGLSWQSFKLSQLLREAFTGTGRLLVTARVGRGSTEGARVVCGLVSSATSINDAEKWMSARQPPPTNLAISEKLERANQKAAVLSSMNGALHDVLERYQHGSVDGSTLLNSSVNTTSASHPAPMRQALARSKEQTLKLVTSYAEKLAALEDELASEKDARASAEAQCSKERGAHQHWKAEYKRMRAEGLGSGEAARKEEELKAAKERIDTLEKELATAQGHAEGAAEVSKNHAAYYRKKLLEQEALLVERNQAFAAMEAELAGLVEAQAQKAPRPTPPPPTQTEDSTEWTTLYGVRLKLGSDEHEVVQRLGTMLSEQEDRLRVLEEAQVSALSFSQQSPARVNTSAPSARESPPLTATGHSGLATALGLLGHGLDGHGPTLDADKIVYVLRHTIHSALDDHLPSYTALIHTAHAAGRSDLLHDAPAHLDTVMQHLLDFREEESGKHPTSAGGHGGRADGTVSPVPVRDDPQGRLASLVTLVDDLRLMLHHQTVIAASLLG